RNARRLIAPALPTGGLYTAYGRAIGCQDSLGRTPDGNALLTGGSSAFLYDDHEDFFILGQGHGPHRVRGNGEAPVIHLECGLGGCPPLRGDLVCEPSNRQSHDLLWTLTAPIRCRDR